MIKATPFPVPPDQSERNRALDPSRSIVVQAPAGSGKTDLLTRRFLRLLGEAEKPEEIVAITFTKAAAAEMRNRVLSELEKVETQAGTSADPLSLEALATRALARSNAMGWHLLDQPAQLRITTIDSFCRSLALQSPLEWGLLSSLGGRLEPVNNPKDLYRSAARRTIELLRGEAGAKRDAVEALLRWRDNSWKDVEDLLVQMLGARNRWWQGFVFDQEQDWDELRGRLEAPFRRGVMNQLAALSGMLDQLAGSRDYALDMARLACATPGKSSPLGLAERAELPVAPFADGLEDAQEAYRDLAGFLLTASGTWRKPGGLNVNHGFPATPQGRQNKLRFGELVESMAQEPGLEAALAACLQPMPTAYTQEEWELVKHCFTVLREAAGHLQVVFSETGSVDFVEVAQIAQRILAAEDGSPSDFALQLGEGIRHLLVDEFQDTSRNQHQLLSRLIAAWPEREGRSCFCVGDPMQSIYGFREAEVELFERLKTRGLEAAMDVPLTFDPVLLTANFRTVPSLVDDLNGRFASIFGEPDGSGILFSPASAMRPDGSNAKTELHLAFTLSRKREPDDGTPGDPDETRASQLSEMVALIRKHLAKAAQMKEGAGDGGKYRIAVLGRARKSLIAVAEALGAAGIGYRAIELVPLRERPEVLDALSLARALLNPVDRTAWLGVLRAPWCGLTLAELHLLTSADDLAVRATPVPELLRSRLPEFAEAGLLSTRAQAAAGRVERVLRQAAEMRASASNLALGSWLELVWKALGGEDTVDAEQQENLRLLWNCLDNLPNGEMDLVGAGPDTGLNAALDQLFAQPDPEASDDFGVQLMTIHKSKGLEFEVVIVPDLEAPKRGPEQAMISWLERGRTGDEGDEGDQDWPTEFLIAPIQSKGEDASRAKKWVDAVKQKRETQEMRRLLYVAATRGREELHLFARPRFSVNTQGEFVLGKPSGSLLATGWPALEAEVTERFAEWAANATAEGKLETVAAGADLLQMPDARDVARGTLVRRLPEGYAAPEFGWIEAGASVPPAGEPTFKRTEGGLRSRIEGTAIHALLDRLSQLRLRLGPGEAAAGLADSLPSVVALVRGHGVDAGTAVKLAAKALAVVLQVATDSAGAWIVANHPEAASETAWTGLVRTGSAKVQQRNLRPDRVFVAPPRTDPNADPVWWIIDYKTSQAHGADLSEEAARRAFLEEHREQHRGQLEAYAQVLKELRGPQTDIFTGIYYPRLLLFDFWRT